MTDKSNLATGKRIIVLRKKRGLTQASLAKKARLPANTIARLERGEHTISTPTLKKLAKVFKVDISDILVS